MSRIFKTKTWEQYEAGLACKRRLRLEETVWRNECFYRGEQWGESDHSNLPRPVFNLVRRVTDYLIGAVAGGNLSITYADESIRTDRGAAERAAALRRSIELLNRHVAYRWERCHMDKMVYGLLLDAALSGDGVAYCYWDPKGAGAGPFGGEIRTMCWNNTRLFVADMNRADIQSQEYIILSGRESVGALRREAKAAGLGAEQCRRIRSDEEREAELPYRSAPELEGEREAKATVLTKFWKQDGVVWFERSTAEVVLRRVKTAQRLYPVAYFNWIPRRNCFHGASPVTSMLPNQRFINRAYAMVMKHMTDTAFSKVVYDKSRIPEWNGEVGQAIAAVGGNLSDAVQVVGTGQLQEGYMTLIENAIATTKELMGATDTALGSAQATNTSAILALQEASRTSVQQVIAAYLQCIEDIACIWADMMCACYADRRPLPYLDGETLATDFADFTALRQATLYARVEVGNTTRYSASGTQTALDRLLDGGYISLRQYLECLPAGILPMRGKLLEEICNQNAEKGGDTEDAATDTADIGADP
ncbi:MAG: hypothetical protein IJW40_01550 [Clostridia bacterium]|nr:hypothetical protein [Clostridia bacterium]